MGPGYYISIELRLSVTLAAVQVLLAYFRLASKAKERRADFQIAASNSFSQMKDAIIYLMRTINFKAVHLQPYDDLADLVEMQIANVSKYHSKKINSVVVMISELITTLRPGATGVA